MKGSRVGLVYEPMPRCVDSGSEYVSLGGIIRRHGRFNSFWIVWKGGMGMGNIESEFAHEDGVGEAYTCSHTVPEWKVGIGEIFYAPADDSSIKGDDQC